MRALPLGLHRAAQRHGARRRRARASFARGTRSDVGSETAAFPHFLLWNGGLGRDLYRKQIVPRLNEWR
jgi:hypothetical protein